MKNSKIVILGAGVCGLTTAIALHQKGFRHISIYERRKTANTLGAGIVLWANASKILHKLNLLEKVKNVGGRISKMKRLSKEEDFLGAVDIELIDQSIGFPSLSIARRDLQEILLDKVSELNIPINYAHNATEIESSENGSTLIQFENQKRAEADIILGSDGRMNSTARSYVNGSNTPVYQNFVNWIGIIESEEDLFTDTYVSDYWGEGERFGIVPINQNKAYWAGGKTLPLNAPKKSKDELLQLFGPWSPAITEIIQNTKEENIKLVEVFDHDPIKKWYKNNVCLIGDAAHAALPTSGQGACQAIEDAFHFATILTESAVAESAFEKFQNFRYEKTTTITMAARDLAKSLFNEDPLYCDVRNKKAQKTDYTAASMGIAKLWSKDLPE